MATLKHYLTNAALAVKAQIVHTTSNGMLAASLADSGIPVTLDPCRTCPDPCDVGHLEYPKMFDIDTVGDMLGTIKPYMRQIVISTGKADWVREVTDEESSLANYISQKSDDDQSASFSSAAATSISYPPSKPTTRLSILNGSHTSHDAEQGSTNFHRVLVLPDYKAVKYVPQTRAGADDLFHTALSAKVGRTGGEQQGQLRSYILPYTCVILLCSHKRRDNRCHIAAPKLERSFCHALESEGWIVDTDLRDEACMGESLEDVSSGQVTDDSNGKREGYMVEKLKDAAEGALEGQKMALILKVSHIGGHKYAGNVIIYTPQGQGTGTGIWYGRVSPHEVPAVTKSTILEGKVLPSLLRGGVNMSREEGQSLLDW